MVKIVKYILSKNLIIIIEFFSVSLFLINKIKQKKLLKFQISKYYLNIKFLIKEIKILKEIIRDKK